jgi:hypothetical protein
MQAGPDGLACIMAPGRRESDHMTFRADQGQPGCLVRRMRAMVPEEATR